MTCNRSPALRSPLIVLLWPLTIGLAGKSTFANPIEKYMVNRSVVCTCKYFTLGQVVGGGEEAEDFLWRGGGVESFLPAAMKVKE